MRKPSIEKFARLLVEFVRDEAISSSDVRIQSNAKSPSALRWKDAISTKDFDRLVSLVIQDTVDLTIFYLLEAIDNDHIRLSFEGEDGARVDLSKDGQGELSGWYIGSEGWIAKYSKERFIDDFKDLERPWEK